MLDVLRGSAATLIFVLHYFALYPFPRPAALAGINNIVLSYFAKGVPLFYALSALSLYFGYFSKRTEPTFLREFFIRRFLRIAPLFYSLLAIGICIFLSRGGKITATQLLANISFTFGLIPGLHESLVGAGWSVGVELLFYVAFPFVITLVTNCLAAATFVVFTVVIAITSFTYFSSNMPASSYNELSILSHGHFFATGILVYFLAQSLNNYCQSTDSRKLVAIAALLLFFATTLFLLTGERFARIPLISEPAIYRTLWLFPVGSLLLFSCMIRPSVLWIRPFVRLGEWSFSLYLLHPLILFLLFDFSRKQLSQEGSGLGRFLGGFVISFALLIFCSALSFHFIERPFMKLAQRLTGRNRQA